MTSTPGPWTYDAKYMVINAQDAHIACMCNGRPADGRRLAAAPELLDALERMGDGCFCPAGFGGRNQVWRREHVERCIRAVDAIAKATGESA